MYVGGPTQIANTSWIHCAGAHSGALFMHVDHWRSCRFLKQFLDHGNPYRPNL